LRRTLPRLAGRLNRWRGIAFYLFLANVHIASARATRFIGHESDTPWAELLLIAGVIALLCLLQFQLGERMAHPSLRLESSLALGRKNTMFALWVALTFINPVVALGPIFQILWQNAYNSWQLYEVERRDKVPGSKVPDSEVSGPKNPEK
jgi:BASS family bile acid:Na+ symporter